MGRRIREVTEVVGFDPETKELLTNTVFEWDSASDRHKYLGKSYVLEQVMETRHLKEDEVEAEWRCRVEVLEWMMQRGIRQVTDVSRLLSRYYRDPQRLMDTIRAEGPAADPADGERAPPTQPQWLSVEGQPAAPAPDGTQAAGGSAEGRRGAA
jgi:hypothetical protein